MRRPGPAIVLVLSLAALVHAPRAAADTLRARVRADRAAAATEGAAPELGVQFVIPRGHVVTGVDAVPLTSHPVPAPNVLDAAAPLAEAGGTGAWCGYQIAFVRVHPLQPQNARWMRVDELD